MSSVIHNPETVTDKNNAIILANITDDDCIDKAILSFYNWSLWISTTWAILKKRRA